MSTERSPDVRRSPPENNFGGSSPDPRGTGRNRGGRSSAEPITQCNFSLVTLQGSASVFTLHHVRLIGISVEKYFGSFSQNTKIMIFSFSTGVTRVIYCLTLRPNMFHINAPLGRFAFGKTPRGPRCAQQARQHRASDLALADLKSA